MVASCCLAVLCNCLKDRTEPKYGQVHPDLPVSARRFALQREDQVLGLPIGQHLDMQLLTSGGETVIKPYTPVSDDSRLGYVDFVIKVQALLLSSWCQPALHSSLS